MSLNILDEIQDCDGLMWQYHLGNYSYDLINNALLTVVEQYLDIPVFPDFATRWHFDDKLAESLIFKSKGINVPNNWIFFDEEQAYTWAKTAKFPIVFKLRKGAGSANVQLIKNKKECKKIISRMFNKGMSPRKIKIRLIVKKKGITGFLKAVRKSGFKRILSLIKTSQAYPVERNYVYFQEYIPDCQFDYRVLIVGNKAYAFRRYVIKNDFRASGSGILDFDTQKIELEVIKAGFEVWKHLNAQCVALDFVKSTRGFVLLEMSYAFVNTVKPVWPGYWDSNLKWHENQVNPLELMLESFLTHIEMNKRGIK